jgi:hypothetical protein
MAESKRDRPMNTSGIIVAGLLLLILIRIIFRIERKRKMQHRFDQDNNYKIFLRRTQQLACIIAHDIKPLHSHSKDGHLLFYDTPDGEYICECKTKTRTINHIQHYWNY